MSPRPKPTFIVCPNKYCEADIMIPDGVKFLKNCPCCFTILDLENNTQERKGEVKP